jgi:predicted transcriptional regulator
MMSVSLATHTAKDMRHRSQSDPQAAMISGSFIVWLLVSKPARRVSKRAQILEMMQRPSGATLAEIRALSGWQRHSVRAFVSTVAKKDQIHIRSMKNQAGERVYLIRG